MENLQPTLKIKTMSKKNKKMEELDNPEAYHMSGKYADVSAEPFIKMRQKFVKNTMVTAKLPKPVAVSNASIVMEQPARNINDMSNISLNDLSFNDQEEALGKDPTEYFKRKNTRISEKLRKTQDVDYINMPPRMSAQQIKEILEKL